MNNEVAVAAPDRRWIVIVAAAVSLTISGAVLYVKVVDRAPATEAPMAPMAPIAPMAPTAPQAPASGAQGMPNVPTMDVAADKLARRLASKDGTADDWALLARSYREMKRYPEALEAYGRALAKDPANAVLAAEAAEVRKNAAAAPR